MWLDRDHVIIPAHSHEEGERDSSSTQSVCVCLYVLAPWLIMDLHTHPACPTSVSMTTKNIAPFSEWLQTHGGEQFSSFFLFCDCVYVCLVTVISVLMRMNPNQVSLRCEFECTLNMWVVKCMWVCVCGGLCSVRLGLDRSFPVPQPYPLVKCFAVVVLSCLAASWNCFSRTVELCFIALPPLMGCCPFSLSLVSHCKYYSPPFGLTYRRFAPALNAVSYLYHC